MRRQVTDTELRRLSGTRPRQILRNDHTRHSGNLVFGFTHTIGLFERNTGDEQFPLVRQVGLIPTNRDRIRLNLQFDIRRWYALRQLLHYQLIDIVIGKQTHVRYIFPNDRNNAIRSGVVLKVGIATRVTLCIQLEISYLGIGIDIHRIGHDTDRSMRLVRRLIAAKVELHLYVRQIFYHRQRDPTVFTAHLTQIQITGTDITLRRAGLDMRIRTAVTEDTDAFRILGSTYLVGSSQRRFKIIIVWDGPLRSYRHKRIAIGPLLTRCLHIDIVRAVPTMICLQRLAYIPVGLHGSLINDSRSCRIRRIDFRIGNQHVIRRSIALP